MRAGPEVRIAELCAARVPVIADVWCNPATSARHAHRLIDHGYHLAALRVVDQSLWSRHVELVAEFRFKTC